MNRSISKLLKFFEYLSFVFVLALGITIFFTVSASPVGGMTADQYLAFLFDSIGKMKGASVAMVAYLISQLVIKFIDSRFRKMVLGSGSILSVKMKGKHKILIVSGVTFLNTLTGLVAFSGLSWPAAAIHSTTLSAFSVFANQIYKQFFEKRD